MRFRFWCGFGFFGVGFGLRVWGLELRCRVQSQHLGTTHLGRKGEFDPEVKEGARSSGRSRCTRVCVHSVNVSG